MASRFFLVQTSKSSPRASVVSEPNVTESSNFAKARRPLDSQNKKFPGWSEISWCTLFNAAVFRCCCTSYKMKPL